MLISPISCMFMDQDTVEVYKLGQIQKIQKEGAKSPTLPPPNPTSYSIQHCGCIRDAK